MVIWILDALTYALTLSLVVLGLGIVFGLMGVINVAHGEFFALGAFGLLIGEEHGLGFYGGVVLALLIAGLAGVLTQIVIVRRLYGNLLMTLLATYGLSIAIRQSLQWKFGPQGHGVTAPVSGTVDIFGTSYPLYRFFIMGISLAALGAAAWFFSRTRAGIVARAAFENRSMAEVIGIRVRRIDMLMFGIGTAMAGLAGAIMAPVLSVTPDVGQQYLVYSFLIVIFVGLETMRQNLFVLVLGALIIGSMSSVLSRSTSGLIAEVAVMGMVVAVLVARPQGLAAR